MNNVKKIVDFIDGCISLLRINFNISKNEDIIILIPPEYKRLLNEFFFKNNNVFEKNLYGEFENIKSLSYMGYDIKFISPTNDCYVFYKDYTLCFPKEKFWYKMKL